MGGDVVLTINWKGTADKLIKADPPVMERLLNKDWNRVLAVAEERLNAY